MLVITLGEIYSVSIECLVKEAELWTDLREEAVVLIGSWRQWQRQASGFPIKLQTMSSWQELAGPGLYFWDCFPELADKPCSTLSPQLRGELAYRALLCLQSLPHQHHLAVLSCPIDKKNCQLAGYPFPGQTEFFEQLWGQEGIMILAGPRLRVALATNHHALIDVPSLITPARIRQKALALHHSMQAIFGIVAPRIAVVGLNPHAGDQGLFGTEEARVLAPVCEQLRQEAYTIEGPIPADTAFFRAWQGEFDAVLAMYHDQGLGPLKSLHFYEAINVTGNIPHLRVSPDHGPAQDLFGKGSCRSDSFRQALLLCQQYLSQSREKQSHGT